MFKLKKIINSNSISPDIIRFDENRTNHIDYGIKPGMAVWLTKDGNICFCQHEYRPTHICVGAGENSDGSRYLLCYSITEDMIFEAPFITNDGMTSVKLGSPVYVDTEYSESGGVQFDPQNSGYNGVLVYKDSLTEYTPFEKVLVRFPNQREG